jgi:hypothetical protein
VSAKANNTATKKAAGAAKKSPAANPAKKTTRSRKA